MSWKIDLTIPTPMGDARLEIESNNGDNEPTYEDIRDYFIEQDDLEQLDYLDESDYLDDED